VGKTTTSLNLAAALSEEGSTVVVEFDLAMVNSADFLAIDCTPDIDPTLHDVLADTETVRGATYPAPGGFDIVPSGTTLDGYAETKPHRIAPVVKALEAEYEYVGQTTNARQEIVSKYRCPNCGDEEVAL
jgi:septum site-determining protein MinD